MNRRTILLFLSSCLAGAVATMTGCRRRRSPEEQVRDTIAALARAVEEKDLKAVRKLISARFQDAEQHDRQEVLAVLRMYFVRYPSINLLTRVTSVDIAPGGDAPARATVVAAMASLPMKEVGDLLRLHADVNRFDLTLIEEPAGQWAVSGATWQAARPEDLF